MIKQVPAELMLIGESRVLRGIAGRGAGPLGVEPTCIVILRTRGTRNIL